MNGKELSEIGCDRFRFIVKLSPGEAGHRVARGAQNAVARTIFPKSRKSAVRFPAVELDHLPAARPVTIDLKSFLAHHNPIVETRTRQAVSAKKRQKPFLQSAPGATGREAFYTGKCLPYSAHPAPTRVSVDEINE